MALKDNLVALWELDEASGTRYDSHGTNHLTDGSSVGRTAGKYSSYGARLASSSGDHLYVADNPALSMNDETFSGAAWIRLTADNGIARLISKVDGDAESREYGLIWKVSAAQFAWRVDADGTGSSTTVEASSFGTPATDGTQWCWVYWYHEQGVGIGISVDNGTINTASHTTGIFQGTSAFYIGSTIAGNLYPDADIQQVGVWRKLLSSDDRIAIYNGGTGLAYSAWDAATGHPASRRMGGVKFAGNQSSGMNRW